jgi:hypothetical protein
MPAAAFPEIHFQYPHADPADFFINQNKDRVIIGL